MSTLTTLSNTAPTFSDEYDNAIEKDGYTTTRKHYVDGIKDRRPRLVEAEFLPQGPQNDIASFQVATVITDSSADQLANSLSTDGAITSFSSSRAIGCGALGKQTQDIYVPNGMGTSRFTVYIVIEDFFENGSHLECWSGYTDYKETSFGGLNDPKSKIILNGLTIIGTNHFDHFDVVNRQSEHDDGQAVITTAGIAAYNQLRSFDDETFDDILDGADVSTAVDTRYSYGTVPMLIRSARNLAPGVIADAINKSKATHQCNVLNSVNDGHYLDASFADDLARSEENRGIPFNETALASLIPYDENGIEGEGFGITLGELESAIPEFKHKVKFPNVSALSKSFDYAPLGDVDSPMGRTAQGMSQHFLVVSKAHRIMSCGFTIWGAGPVGTVDEMMNVSRKPYEFNIRNATSFGHSAVTIVEVEQFMESIYHHVVVPSLNSGEFGVTFDYINNDELLIEISSNGSALVSFYYPMFVSSAMLPTIVDSPDRIGELTDVSNDVVSGSNAIGAFGENRSWS